MNPRDVDAVIQAVRFELYRENIYGALEIVEAARAAHPDPRYVEQAARIRSWLRHLESREAYVEAQERQYHGLRWKPGLKLLEKRIRMLIGRKTRKLVARRVQKPEFRELEQEIAAVRPRHVLDAGSGEGRVALALGARHPEIRVEAVEISATNARLAGQLNRFANVGFRQGLAEEVHLHFPAGSFDLAYSFEVLEHVRDVDETVRSIEAVLRPGGRFAFLVPMCEVRAIAPIPDYQPVHGYADHCRVFTESGLVRRFGGRKNFRLVKILRPVKRSELPDCFEPIEFGSFFVSYATDG